MCACVCISVSEMTCVCVSAGCPKVFVRVNGGAHFIYNCSDARSTMSHLCVLLKLCLVYEGNLLMLVD